MTRSILIALALGACTQPHPAPSDAREAVRLEWVLTFGYTRQPGPVSVEYVPWHAIAADQHCGRTVRGCYRYDNKRIIVSDDAPACHTQVHEWTHAFYHAAFGRLPREFVHMSPQVWGPDGVMRRAERRLCGYVVE